MPNVIDQIIYERKIAETKKLLADPTISEMEQKYLAEILFLQTELYLEKTRGDERGSYF